MTKHYLREMRVLHGGPTEAPYKKKTTFSPTEYSNLWFVNPVLYLFSFWDITFKYKTSQKPRSELRWFK